MYAIRRPSGDHRAPRPMSRSFWGTPPSGAGTTQVPMVVVLPPRTVALNAMSDPSGDTESPPLSTCGATTRFADAVRLTGAPPVTNLTHTSTTPRASDMYATHLPSGEIAGEKSFTGPLVSRTTRDTEGPKGARDHIQDPPMPIAAKSETAATS